MDEHEWIIELQERRGVEHGIDSRDAKIAMLTMAWERALVELFDERAAA